MMTELPVDAFAVWPAVWAIPRAYYWLQVDGSLPLSLSVDAMQQGGKTPRRHARNGLPGDDILSPECHPMLTRPRHQH